MISKINNMKKLYTLFFFALSSICASMASDDVPAPDKTGMELTAQEWNKQVVAGWNLGNSLESAPDGTWTESTEVGWKKSYDTSSEQAWGNPKTTQAMIKAVKQAGFNAIRIPVRWGCHITDKETMTISEDWLKRVKEIVDYCISNDMYVIINTHHDKWLESQATPSKKADVNDKLAKLWTNIANYFAEYDGRLAFAGTNETHMKDDWNEPAATYLAVQNSYLQTFIDAVRATGGKNYYRHLIVQTWACNPYFGLSGKLIVPKDIEENGYSRMSIEFHYYNPYNYCAGNKGNGYYHYWGTQYTGTQKDKAAPDNEKTMSDFFNQVDNEWVSQGLGIVVGEWGISDRYTSSLDKKAIHENMTYYCKYLTNEVRTRGYSAFIWDNNVFGNGTEKFGIFDRKDGMKIKADWIVDGIKAGIEESGLGIEEIQTSNTKTQEIYDLQGRQVTEPKPGQIYIKNRQKYLAK